jgi:hypothetical protein
MGKKITTRRSISVKGLTYQRIKKFCDSQNIPVSGWLESIIAAELDAKGVPEELVLAPKAQRKDASEEIVSQHFTF